MTAHPFFLFPDVAELCLCFVRVLDMYILNISLNTIQNALLF